MRVPKTVIVIIVAAVAGFVLGIVTPGQKASDDPLINGILAGLGGATIFGVAAGYIAALVVSGLKCKPAAVVIGIITLPMPALSFWPVIAAIRIGRPDSRWAKRYYGPEKMKVAESRFPAK